MPISPVPALPDTARIQTYAIAAQTGPFNVNFQIYGDGADYAQWLEVWLNGVQLTATAQWTVSSPSGSLASVPRPITDAQVTLITASTGTLVILGAQRPRRLAEYDESRAITAHDQNLDENSTRAIEREAWDGKSRVLRVAPGETLALLPPVATRANLLAGFDQNGNIVPLAQIPEAVATVSPAVLALLNSATLTVFRNSLGVRRVLDVTQFGAVADSATDSKAAFQAAYDAALPGEQIWVPAGNGRYVLASATVQNAKRVEWVLEQGINFALIDAQRAFTGLNTPVNYPVDGYYGHAELLAALPPGHGRYISFTLANDGIIAAPYESIALFVVGQTFDPLDATVHDLVGGSLRGYVGAEGARAYAAHLVALAQAGIVNAGLVGMEIDITNPASGSEVNGYSDFQKIGLAIYSTGPKRSSRAIEIGTASSPFYNGLHIHVNAIDAAAGSAILYDTKFAVQPTGAVIAGGKDTSNRQVQGVELREIGQVWISATANAATQILTKTGTPGAGTVGQIIAQQNDSGGNATNFVTMEFVADDATNGSEDSSVVISGFFAGAGSPLLVANGGRIGPGNDNVQNAGNATFRYATVFAGTGAINTSGADEKVEIEAVPDDVLDAWEDVEIVKFKFKDAVEAKGDRARWHSGWVADRVIAAFEKHGLDPFAFGGVCKDELTEKVRKTRQLERQRFTDEVIERVVSERQGTMMVRKTIKETVRVPMTEVLPVVNEAGEPVMEEYRVGGEGFETLPDGSVRLDANGKPIAAVVKKMRPVFEHVPVMESYIEEYFVNEPSGKFRLGLRYDECEKLEAAVIRRRAERLEATMAKEPNQGPDTLGERGKPVAPPKAKKAKARPAKKKPARKRSTSGAAAT